MRLLRERREPVTTPLTPALMVYRIIESTDAERAFTGDDSMEKGGRWSEPGHAVIYTSGSLPLAALELLVHLDGDVRQQRFVCVAARIPATVSLTRCQKLPREWNARPPKDASRLVGSRWLRTRRHAVLAVPSAVVPTEHNFLIDPAHPDFFHIEVSAPVPFRFDPRLVRLRRGDA
jgi:RES domain-containing protein